MGHTMSQLERQSNMLTVSDKEIGRDRERDKQRQSETDRDRQILT